MNARFILSRGLISVMALFLVAAGMEAAAQTRTKTRPTMRTNTTASYKYAYEHGYRAGYEDGFVKGKSDFTDGAPRDIENSDAYNRADRTYKPSMGTRIEYQEGYRIGFEIAYNDGYYGRPYTVSIPANLGKSVIAAINAAGPGEVAQNQPVDEPQERPAANTRPRTSPQRGSFSVPDGVQMKIRLTTQINTKTNREGDRFLAVVLDPSDYAEATIEGHIAKLNKSGQATGKTELALVFDTIQLRDGRSGRLAAQIEKVYQSESVKTVDEEGNVESGSRTKETAVRSVGGAALGAIIGGIAGGGKGAAIGAAIGAGAGAGTVFIDGGKDLVLEPGTEILIRTAAPANSQ